jgi:hypothetical protein
MVRTSQMGGHRFHGPAPAQEVLTPMQFLSTKRLADALQAGFARCQASGRPLSTDQEIDVMAAVFEAFATEIAEEMRHG